MQKYYLNSCDNFDQDPFYGQTITEGYDKQDLQKRANRLNAQSGEYGFSYYYVSTESREKEIAGNY